MKHFISKIIRKCPHCKSNEGVKVEFLIQGMHIQI